MVKTYGNYIGGKWIKSETGETFKSINPANKQVLGIFQKSNQQDVRKAIDSAEKAFPKWSSVPAPRRGEILLKVAELLKKDKERLAKILTTEMGKVIAEARGDVQEAIDIAEYMAGEGRRLLGHTTPSELRNKFCMTIRIPIGVVGLITPWNFPIAIPAWKIMPALICGNAVVFKPSSDTPLCAVEFVKILEKAGVPKGVVNLVTGPGDTAGMELVTNPKVRGISFTGSKETGEEIVKNAGLKKVGLELGGKNPIIVMDDAKLELAVDGIIWGGFGTTGQRCTAASRVIVHEKIRTKLENALVARIKKLKLGSGLDPKTDVGPLINQRAVEKVDNYVKIGEKAGAKLLIGGGIAKTRNGFFYLPTLFTNCRKNMRICQEEIFGPVVCLISVKNLEEAIAVANGIEYGLSSSIYTESLSNAFKAIEKIEAGITYVNSSTIGSEVHLPFGGVKGTGNGTREAGIEGIHEFSETKTVYIDYSGKLQRAQIDIE
jgi:acyl-CoA reductase-like NAD-dependent aldehyde dehydrogenase